MTKEENRNLYNPTNLIGMNEFEIYKYLTGHDTDLQELKMEIKKIVAERQLSALMNDTKWLELQRGINTLPFPPVYNQKLVHLSPAQNSFDTFEKEPSYFGDWSSFWEEGMAVFFTIEWIEIRPFLLQHQGSLVTPKITDETEQLILLLNNLHIPFEQNGRSIFIYGYI